MASFRLTPAAIEDLDAIWLYIYKDNPAAADAVEAAIKSACALLAQKPLAGHTRRDLTDLPVRFLPIPEYPNYLIVYDPSAKPLQIIRILHAMRDVKKILQGP